MIDSANVSGSLKSFPAQCRQVINDIASQEIPLSCLTAQNVVISGMGGSALGGRVIASLERQVLRVPIAISTEYHLPNYVNDKSLVVISSYSGNTRETIASLAEAQARGAQIFIITGGGKLAEMITSQHLPGFVFSTENNPSGQPRMGLGYNILSLTSLLARCQFISLPENLNLLPQFLTDQQVASDSAWKSLAEKIAGKLPILVASEHLKGAVHCFKNQLNENSKTFSAMFDFPELSHHLLEGLSFPKSNPENLIFLLFESNKYHPEIVKSYPVVEQILTRQKIPWIKVPVNGSSKFFEVMDLIQAGGFTALYLADVLGIDPGPIPWVDWYKDEIRKVV